LQIRDDIILEHLHLIGLSLTVPYALFNLTSLRTSNPCTISTPYGFTA
jgi:hypothetical protein